jgi:ATP-binding protein involved in chromosome partitioning
MFQELKVPTLSVVENMAYFLCDNCDKKHFLFGPGYLNMIKDQYGI